MNIILVTTECLPFASTNDLADLVSKLAKDIEKEGHNVKVVLPRYGFIDPANFYIERLPSEFKFKFNDKLIVASAFKGILPESLVNVLFIESQNYFSNSKDIYLATDYENEERSRFFSHATLEVIDKLKLFPDIVHFFNPNTAAIATLLASNQQENLSNIKQVFTIHDLLNFKPFRTDTLNAIKYSDYVTTFSNGYAHELLSSTQNPNLSTLLFEKKDHFWGQLIGIDEYEYNPETDRTIAQTYSKNYFTAGKRKCKEDLLSQLNLEVNPQIPLFSIISKINEDEGLDKLLGSLPSLLSCNLQLIIHGKGDYNYEKELLNLSSKHKNLHVCIGHNRSLSKKIYAGSDFLIYLPDSLKNNSSGLSILTAMKYGCVPLAPLSYAAKDIIVDINTSDSGNGIVLKSDRKDDLIDSINVATRYYKNKDLWPKFVKEVMSFDSNKLNTVNRYVDCYKNLSANVYH